MNQMWHDVLAFDFSAFSFIRPQGLWLFILLGVWVLIHLFSLKQKNNWQKHIAPSLQPYIITRGSTWRNQFPFIGFLVALVCGVIALSGPSWQKEELPESKVSAKLYIGLSLSPTMLCTDLQPNRLERAKLKIEALLKANPGIAAGIYVYAGTPHLLLPPTTDYVLINQQLENLHPNMMPLKGNNTSLLFQQLDSTFQKLQAPSTFVWITDEINEQELSWLERFTARTPQRVEMIPVSTPGGALIPGTSIRSALNTKAMAALQNIKNVTLNNLTLDDSDVEALAKRIAATRDFYLDPADQSEQRRDMGLIFIWPMLVLIAISFRKGAVIYGVLFFMLIQTGCSYNQSGAELWYSRDKIGYEYYQAGDFEKALEYLEDTAYRALCFYHLGDYLAAAELSRHDSSATGKYNLGLALFNLGLYEEAAKAFEEAHQLNPNLKSAHEAALTATQYATENTPAKVQEERKKKITGTEIVEDIGKSEELSSDQFDKKDDKDDPNAAKNKNQMDSGERTGEESEKPDFSEEPEEQMESINILLKKTAADPSDFLRKRFKMQKDVYYPNEK